MFANSTIPLKYKILAWYSICTIVSYLAYTYLDIDTFIAVFQAANTLGICLLAFYLFKVHAINNIRIGIEQQQDAHQLLHNQTDTLNSQKHILENTIASQRLTLATLSNKVQTWRDTWNNTYEQHNHELQIRLTALQEKRRLQSYQATVESTRRIVLAQAIEQARAQLTDQFASEKEGAPFLADILDYIQEKT